MSRQDVGAIQYQLNKTVVLVGMMGAGKTAVGRALATKLGGEHAKGSAITLRMLKDRLNTTKIGPLLVLADHTDEVTNLGGPIGDHG